MKTRALGFNSFNAKIALLVSMTCIAVVLVCTGIYLQSFRQTIKENRETLYANFDVLAKNQVENAISLLKAVHEKEKGGELTREEAMKAGANLVRSLRYGNDGYFWVDTKEGVNVVLLGRDAEGKSRIDAQDKKGNYYVRDFIKNGVQAGGGYTDYWFTKKDGNLPLPKRSYTLEFKPFEWVVGTGNYTDDIETLLAAKEAALKRKLFLSILLMLTIAGFGLASALFVSFSFAKKITRQLGGEPDYIEGIVQRISAGDLTIEFSNDTEAATGILSAMKTMSRNLREMVTGIKTASQNLSSGSKELSTSSEQISKGMGEQARSAAQISAAVSDMSNTVLDLSKNATAIVNSTEHTLVAAKEGENTVDESIVEVKQIAETVNESASVIRSLGDRSKQIGDIVNVINDIADQTNLLALNAAIEAARAGDAGRGFAVVADEVRKLAERTAQSTSEISTSIAVIQGEVARAVTTMEKVTKQVDSGVVLSSRAGDALGRVLMNIGDLRSMVREIEEATKGLSSVSYTISGQIEDVASTSKETSSGAVVIASSSADLAQLASTLKQIVDRFQV